MRRVPGLVAAAGPELSNHALHTLKAACTQPALILPRSHHPAQSQTPGTPWAASGNPDSKMALERVAARASLSQGETVSFSKQRSLRPCTGRAAALQPVGGRPVRALSPLLQPWLDACVHAAAAAHAEARAGLLATNLDVLELCLSFLTQPNDLHRCTRPPGHCNVLRGCRAHPGATWNAVCRAAQVCRQWRRCLTASNARFWALLLQRLRSPEALPANPPFSQWNTGAFTINWRSAQVPAHGRHLLDREPAAATHTSLLLSSWPLQPCWPHIPFHLQAAPSRSDSALAALMGLGQPAPPQAPVVPDEVRCSAHGSLTPACSAAAPVTGTAPGVWPPAGCRRCTGHAVRHAQVFEPPLIPWAGALDRIAHPSGCFPSLTLPHSAPPQRRTPCASAPAQGAQDQRTSSAQDSSACATSCAARLALAGWRQAMQLVMPPSHVRRRQGCRQRPLPGSRGQEPPWLQAGQPRRPQRGRLQGAGAGPALPEGPARLHHAPAHPHPAGGLHRQLCPGAALRLQHRSPRARPHPAPAHCLGLVTTCASAAWRLPRLR